jgi:hypothetical protein
MIAGTETEIGQVQKAEGCGGITQRTNRQGLVSVESAGRHDEYFKMTLPNGATSDNHSAKKHILGSQGI